MGRYAHGAKPSTGPEGPPPGSQTLLRGLAILEAVAGGARDLAGLSAALGTTRSTTHRLAAALVEQRYLTFAPREGYGLGPSSSSSASGPSRRRR